MLKKIDKSKLPFKVLYQSFFVSRNNIPPPSGLKGIKRLKELSTMDEETASDDMITFLVLNTAGVTLLPTTVMSIRQSLGAKNPLDFVFIGIFATACASFVGLSVDRIIRRKKR